MDTNPYLSDIVGNFIIKIIGKDNAQHAMFVIDGVDPNARDERLNVYVAMILKTFKQ